MKNFEKDFEEWLIKQDYIIKQFYEPKLVHEGFGFVFRNLPESMQYGVYVDFLEQNDCEILNSFYGYLKNGCSVPLARNKSLIESIEVYENNSRN